MRPQKGHFEVVPYVGSKPFPSFGKKKELISFFLFLEKIYSEKNIFNIIFLII